MGAAAAVVLVVVLGEGQGGRSMSGHGHGCGCACGGWWEGHFCGTGWCLLCLRMCMYGHVCVNVVRRTCSFGDEHGRDVVMRFACVCGVWCVCVRVWQPAMD